MKVIFPIIVFLLSISLAGEALSASQADKESYTIYSVKKGDSLWEISLRYYKDTRFVDFLREYNKLEDQTRIKAGEKIRIPHEMTYKVEPGDILPRISRKLLGDAGKYLSIAEYNDIKNIDEIISGKILRIPLIPSLDKAIAEKRGKKKAIKESVEEKLPSPTTTLIPEKEKMPDKELADGKKDVTEPEVKKPSEEKIPTDGKTEETSVKKTSEENAQPPLEEKSLAGDKAEELSEKVLPVEKPSREERALAEEKIPIEEKAEEPSLSPTEEAIKPSIEERALAEEKTTTEEKAEEPSLKPSEEKTEEIFAEPSEETTKPSMEEEKPLTKKKLTPQIESPPAIPIDEEKKLSEVLGEKKEPEIVWPPVSPWVEQSPAKEEKSFEPEKLSGLLEATSAWSRAISNLSLEKFRKEKELQDRGVQLPMNSLLQIEGYKSATVEYNKTHYFGKSDASSYSGSYYGSGYYDDSMYGYGGYDSYSSYGSYGNYGSSYGGYGGYGSSYGSYGSYGGYGGRGYGGYGYGRDTGFNVEQELEIHLHGRIGGKTHVDVDYNDTGRSQFGGMGQKEQKISVWYEGDKDEIIKKASFGDINLNIPSTRFLSMSRSLFGAQVVAEIAGIRLTAFGTRTKGVKETWTSSGQSRQAGGGIGNRIMDINYIKERYYAIHVGDDGMIHDSYLPIESGSEQIYIDDGIGTNNDSGISTAQGYFDFQYPGDDYNMDYTTGQIEFLKNVSSNYKIIVAYKYRGNGGGTVGNAEAMFVDDDKDGVIDEKEDPSDRIGYVVIKEAGQHGSELKNVYSMGNKNISRRRFDLSIWRENGTEYFQTDEGTVPYTQIFGLDADGDGLVDDELIDFEKGILTFRSPRPFVIDDPGSIYYKYRDQLNNEAIYAENPSYNDQKYIIQADYSYQTPSIYLGRLNIIPESEEVIVNGSKLKRGIDYIMVYEVGSVEIFRELDEYDKITINYEYSPFGGIYQQTIAGIWAEYSFSPKSKEPRQDDKKRSPQGIDSLRQDYSNNDYNFESSFGRTDSMYGSSYGSSYGGYDSYSSSYGGYDSYGSSYGSYGGYGGYDSYSSYGSRRGRSYGTSRSVRSGGYTSGRGGRGLNLSLGYIYNAGQRSLEIPDVNSAPSRLQALVMNGNWGQEFNVARIFGLLPFVSVKGAVPLSIFLDIESAYSRNNSNSVGYAMIDSMEGAKESTRIPAYKFSWQIGSVPVDTPEIDVDNRAIFYIVPKDKEASYGNYMKNRDTSAREINPLSYSIEQHKVMEIGYDLNDNSTWGALSHSIAPTGADFSKYEFLEIWMKVEGDKNVNFNIDFGSVSEDTDEDFRLDSEDLPGDLTDKNGDHKIDILDLSKENLPSKDRYKGNGRLDSGEDTGWDYNNLNGKKLDSIGKDNSVLDTEDLDGDVVLDTSNSYYEFAIPLDSIPSEWVRKENKESGWMFLSIPIEKAISQGRSPSWGVIKHVRIWFTRNSSEPALGKFQWYSITMSGNSWDKGLIVDESGKLLNNTDEKILVGTKNNQEFEDYLKEYRTIENNKDFSSLHPYVGSALTLSDEKREQALTVTYRLEPKSAGYTMRKLKGQRSGNGQDFSKHQNIRLWLYGDGNRATFIMRLGSNVDDFGAGSPITTTQADKDDPYSYSYYSYSSYGGRGYYEYTKPIDFIGWKLITIPLEDANNDGQPDSLKAVNDPSIANISQILVGIRNETQFPIDGEIWVNEVHLNEPIVKSGWARRLNLSTGLANIFDLQAGYAKQDKNFENSAGQTSRSSQYSMGYSTSNYDYNVNAGLKIISWLPISYDISHRESESIREYGIISSYDSGKTKTDNKTFSVSFDKERLPSLSFSYDNQETWNERRGNELSNLYSSGLKYSLGTLLSINTNYSHEILDVESISGSDSSNSGSYYYSGYYGSNNDSIIDTGTASLQISPSKSFSINPSYEVRRELEKGTTTDGKDDGIYKIAGRDQRFSLRPTLRSFLGVRPSISSRYSFSEDWYRNEKDASITTSLNAGLNFTLKNIISQKKDKKPKKEEKSLKAEPPKQDSPSIQQNPENQNSPDNKEPEEQDSIDQKGTEMPIIENNYEDDLNRFISPEQRMEIMEDRFQEGRGNWIESEKNELRKKFGNQEEAKGEEKSVLRRSLESFTFNIDFGTDINDYLRQLESDMGFMDIINLEAESKYRSRSSRNKRLSIRSNFDPFTWSSIGFNSSFTNRFSKSMGTASNSNSTNLGGDLKLSRKSLSLMLRYDMTRQDTGNRSGQISDSTSHSPSITIRNNWQSGVGSSFGVRTTLRNQERSGIETKSLIVAPNFNVDYDMHVVGEMGLPFTDKTIKLDHNLDVSNTFSATVRREKLGVNRDEKSEQYGTSLDLSYNLRERIRTTIRLSIDYNHDRVRESADYMSVSGSLMMRGEFR